MKKLLAILAVCFVMVSCQFWHETFDSPADCAVWYLDQIYEASIDGDPEEAADIYADMVEWYDSLDEEDALEADLAAISWASQHPEFDYDDYNDYDYGW
jgi:hypothetical protein